VPFIRPKTTEDDGESEEEDEAVMMPRRLNEGFPILTIGTTDRCR